MRDTEAAKNLLYRRTRCLADYENANKALDKARVKGKEIAAVSTIYMDTWFVAVLILLENEGSWGISFIELCQMNFDVEDIWKITVM